MEALDEPVVVATGPSRYLWEVAGGGAATVHQLEAARGNLDMWMTSPTIYTFQKTGKAMYANEADAPALAENLALLMWFPFGDYHYAVRGESDIQYLDDIEGTTVFIGPAGGGAYDAAKGWIEATTGLVAGEDYEAITANWTTGFQAFQDDKIDMYVNGCIDPVPAVPAVYRNRNRRLHRTGGSHRRGCRQVSWHLPLPHRISAKDVEKQAERRTGRVQRHARMHRRSGRSG